MDTRAWFEEQVAEGESCLPFSFVYGGMKSDGLLKAWSRSAVSEKVCDRRASRVITWEDPDTGLEVTCRATEYLDFPAVEWVLHFENKGKADSPILQDIEALDALFPSGGECNVHSINGSGHTAGDFAPVVDPISKGMKLTKGCFGGRSSSGGYGPSQLGGCCPFFNLEDAGENRGVVLAIGWTGQWLAAFDHRTESEIRVTAGMELTHLKLHPGERIRTPSMLLVFWEGSDPLIGNNLLRRFLVDHKLPRTNGEPVEVPIGACTAFKHLPDTCWLPGLGGDNGLAEQNQIAHARRCAQLGIEYYWLDAGWFESSRSFGPGKWYDGVGNWFVKKEGFPGGLKPLSDAVKKLGLKFILWFEPERVCPGTQLWEEDPQWLLPQPNPPEEQGCLSTLVHKFLLTRNISEARNSSVLNLGNTEARSWLTDHISSMIAEYGIDVYRHDFNMDPLPIWRHADADDRQGITEIHYIEGLYAFWDELLERHPGLIIDNCSSGSRRIDVETMSRSVTLWRSDYCLEPIGTQGHTYGLNLFMPGHAGGLSGKDVGKYGFRGLLSGGAAICWDLEQEDFPDDCARALIEEAKRLRPLFYGEFWPLTPYSLSKNCWMAWQFHRPDLGSGAIFAFRRSQMAETVIALSINGIKAEDRCEVVFSDTSVRKTFTGRELIEHGLEVKEDDAPASVLLTYAVMDR